MDIEQIKKLFSVLKDYVLKNKVKFVNVAIIDSNLNTSFNIYKALAEESFRSTIFMESIYIKEKVDQIKDIALFDHEKYNTIIDCNNVITNENIDFFSSAYVLSFTKNLNISSHFKQCVSLFNGMFLYTNKNISTYIRAALIQKPILFSANKKTEKNVVFLGTNGIGENIQLTPCMKQIYIQGYKISLVIKQEYYKLFECCCFISNILPVQYEVDIHYDEEKRQFILLNNKLEDFLLSLNGDIYVEDPMDVWTEACKSFVSNSIIGFDLSRKNIPVYPTRHHRIISFPEVVGLKSNVIIDDIKPDINFYEMSTPGVFDDHKNISLCFSRNKNRRLSPYHLNKLISKLREDKWSIFICGFSFENSMQDELDFSEFVDISKVDVATMASYLKKMDIVYTTDTGPMHIAVALEIPCIIAESVINPFKSNAFGLDNIYTVSCDISRLTCKQDCNRMALTKTLKLERKDPAVEDILRDKDNLESKYLECSREQKYSVQCLDLIDIEDIMCIINEISFIKKNILICGKWNEDVIKQADKVYKFGSNIFVFDYNSKKRLSYTKNNIKNNIFVREETFLDISFLENIIRNKNIDIVLYYEDLDYNSIKIKTFIDTWNASTRSWNLKDSSLKRKIIKLVSLSQTPSSPQL